MRCQRTKFLWNSKTLKKKTRKRNLKTLLECAQKAIGILRAQNANRKLDLWRIHIDFQYEPYCWVGKQMCTNKTKSWIDATTCNRLWKKNQTKKTIEKEIKIRKWSKLNVETKECLESGANGLSMEHPQKCKAKNGKCSKWDFRGNLASHFRVKSNEIREAKLARVEPNQGWDNEIDSEKVHVLRLQNIKNGMKQFYRWGKLEKTLLPLLEKALSITITEKNISEYSRKELPTQRDWRRRLLCWLREKYLSCGVNLCECRRMTRKAMVPLMGEGMNELVGRCWIRALELIINAR